MRSLEARFWEKVDKSGPIVRPDLGPCWVWTSSIRRDGYGMIWIGAYLDGEARAEFSHRVAFFLARGRWPEPCALHLCDTRACVRDEHLFEGTKADNNRDRAAKGRSAITDGELHPRAKLTAAAVREIRSSSEPLLVFARRYGVSTTAVCLARSGRTWKSIDDGSTERGRLT